MQENLPYIRRTDGVGTFGRIHYITARRAGGSDSAH